MPPNQHIRKYPDEVYGDTEIPRGEILAMVSSETRWEAAVDEENRLRIRQRAYQLYLQRAGRAGDALNDWLTAEAEIRDEEVAHRGPARIRDHRHRGMLTDTEGRDIENPA